MTAYTLEYDMARCVWVLTRDACGTHVQTFLSRRDATEGGIVQALIGPHARLRIRDADGRYAPDLARRMRGDAMPPARMRAANGADHIAPTTAA